MNSAPASSPAASSHGPTTPEDLAARLRAQKEQAGPWIVTVRAPWIEPECVLDSWNEPVRTLWDPPEGPVCVALGAAETLSGSGRDRADQILRRARTLFDNLVIDDTEAPGAPRPRCFGGFSFQAARAVTAPWSEFGDARFVLPQFSYVRGTEGAYFSVAVGRERRLGASGVDGAAAFYAKVCNLVGRFPSLTPLPRATKTEAMPLETWTDLVQRIVGGIASRRFEKVVAARRTRIAFDAEIDPLSVLGGLALAKSCTRFAFRFADATFLGATPERLISKVGSKVETEALAGSSRADLLDSAPALSESAKDRAEHDLVVREIVRCLDPVCTEITYPDRPRIRRLRHIWHLCTPIAATLAEPIHVLKLAERLHPTPAVGGVPTEDALEWIADNEPTERGWYAAPIGWFDDLGDGEFDVALRSGLVSRNEAYLFAGAGIVRDSDPAGEYAETELKLASLSSALGLE